MHSNWTSLSFVINTRKIPVYQGDSYKQNIEFDFIMSFTTPHTYTNPCLIIRLYKLVHFYLLIPIYLWGVTDEREKKQIHDVEIDNNNKNFFVICSIRCSYHSFWPYSSVYDAWIMFSPNFISFQFFTYNDDLRL